MTLENPDYSSDQNQNDITRITLRTDPSKHAQQSIDHWDPQGKYTFNNK